MLRQGTKIPHPVLCGPAKDLHPRVQFVALARSSGADAVKWRFWAAAARTNVGSAMRAEHHCRLLSTCSRLDVVFRLSGKELEGPFKGRSKFTECGTGKGLAILAMTNPEMVRVDLRFVREIAAVAAAVDLHFRLILPHGVSCNESPQHNRLFW
jgi:hypothetical protein